MQKNPKKLKEKKKMQKKKCKKMHYFWPNETFKKKKMGNCFYSKIDVFENNIFTFLARAVGGYFRGHFLRQNETRYHRPESATRLKSNGQKMDPDTIGQNPQPA